jgi:hypothetical protein
VLVDLEGKGRRVRTVAIPVWVKQGINAWMTAAGVEDGRLLRAVSKGGKVKESMSGWAVWSVVERCAKQIGFERFGAHDLRQALPEEWRRAGTDQVSLGTQLHPNHGTLSRVGAGTSRGGQRFARTMKWGLGELRSAGNVRPKCFHARFDGRACGSGAFTRYSEGQ